MAPVAVSVVLPPLQTRGSSAVAVKVGVVAITTIAWALDEQLKELVPTTLYADEAEGVITTTADVCESVVHEYVRPPFAVSVTEEPAHTLDDEGIAVIVGTGLAEMLIVPPPTQVPSLAVTV